MLSMFAPVILGKKSVLLRVAVNTQVYCFKLIQTHMYVSSLSIKSDPGNRKKSVCCQRREWIPSISLCHPDLKVWLP